MQAMTSSAMHECWNNSRNNIKFLVQDNILKDLAPNKWKKQSERKNKTFIVNMGAKLENKSCSDTIT
jgi:hypothetical protein